MYGSNVESKKCCYEFNTYDKFGYLHEDHLHGKVITMWFKLWCQVLTRIVLLIIHSSTESRPLPSKPLETVDDSGEDSPSRESGIVSGIAIGFTFIVILAVGGFIFAFYRRTRMNRYRSQEFLLTDSVFRYDGYSQVDQPWIAYKCFMHSVSIIVYYQCRLHILSFAIATKS